MSLGLSTTSSHHAVWLIAAAAASGVVLRPWRIPEAVWALAGAAALVVPGLLPWREALRAVGAGSDVYLFLAGMMLLSEIARREGLFDHLAGIAVRRSEGSAWRLFVLVYAIGVLVTVLMSNDATAVVLTPAVCAAAKKARANPMPYLFACAFIANAASFVLPISNPANLVVYGDRLPPLLQWVREFAAPSVLSIAATFVVLWACHRRELSARIEASAERATLSPTGRWTAWGIVGVTLALLLASALDLPLGWPTAASCGLLAAIIFVRKREAPWQALRGISWSVLPLVAGLFVLVEGLRHAGVLAALSDVLRSAEAASAARASWGAALGAALACNLVNNLPAGLIAGSSVAAAHLGPALHGAIAIGIDLGPNLSVTGSLATILWLIALRREGQTVSGWQFLRIGSVAMPAALLLALLAHTLQQGT
jgi:arsenical pump membrane protein